VFIDNPSIKQMLLVLLLFSIDAERLALMRLSQFVDILGKPKSVSGLSESLHAKDVYAIISYLLNHLNDYSDIRCEINKMIHQ
jgi:mannitol/fructose-specific phosphotransferase system IIA component (Ntr-type)